MKRLFFLLVLFLLTACSQGPDADVVRADMAAQLDEALPGYDLEIVSFSRRGSQADGQAPAHAPQRIVYFDTTLKINQDINFGAWGSPGISALISTLGAGPRGIEGITSGGNRAGDLIKVHGTALYRQQDEQWALVAPVAYTPANAAQTADLPRGPAGTLATIWNTLRSFPPDAAPEQNQIIEDELLAAQRNINARLARSTNGYAIAAGTEHGQYLRVARALFSFLDTPAAALITHGGEENLELLREGKVTLALVQGDSAQDAYEGTGVFSREGPYTSLRSIGSLYPEPFHVLTRADSGLSTMTDLQGKRIAIGQEGSASRTTALRVLVAHGLDLDDIQPVELSIGGALIALRLGEVDAVMQVIGTPSNSIRNLHVSTPLRLLPLSKEAITLLTDNRMGYFAYDIARGTYPEQRQDVPTIATAALLLTDVTVPNAEIEALTRHVFASGRDYAGLGSAQGSQISVATSTIGLSVPMHPAAAETLESLARAAEAASQSPAVTGADTQQPGRTLLQSPITKENTP